MIFSFTFIIISIFSLKKDYLERSKRKSFKKVIIKIKMITQPQDLLVYKSFFFYFKRRI